MRINPQRLIWTRVTERTDGTSIPGEIDYTLGVEVNDTIEERLVVVGALQPDNTYIAQLGDMAWEPGVHTVALRATEKATGLDSTWSNTTSFEIVDAAPRPPLAVAVE